MKVALFGAGRIGPLHARTLLAHGRGRSAGASWTSSLSVPRPPRRSWVAASLRRVDEALADSRRGHHLRLDGRPSGASSGPPSSRGMPTFCEKPLAASLEESIAVRARHRGLPACPSSWASSDASTRPTWRPGASSSPAPSATSTSCRCAATTRSRPPRSSSPPPAACSATSPSTTWTSCASSPVERWTRSTSSARRRASRSTRSTTTSPTPWPSCASMTAPRWRSAGHGMTRSVTTCARRSSARVTA